MVVTKLERRDVIAGLLSTALLSPCREAAASSREYDAIVDPGGYASICEAPGTRPIERHASAPHPAEYGSWREKVTLDKPFIHLVREHRDRGIVTYDAWSGQRSPNGKPRGTRRSATLTITAPDCALRNPTVVNSFDYDQASAAPASSPALGRGRTPGCNPGKHASMKIAVAVRVPRPMRTGPC